MPCNKIERLIYLTRHGKIEMENNERRYIGQIDIPLSDEGRQQASLLAEQFRRKELSHIFCSDLTRSIATAKIISKKLNVKCESRHVLREISMGDWEGKTFREIAQYYPEEYAKRGNNIASYRIPGAESFEECMQRIITAFSNIVNSTEGNVLIVGHAGTNRLLLCHILGMPIENLFRISQDYGCINILICDAGQCRVKLVNGLIDTVACQGRI